MKYPYRRDDIPSMLAEIRRLRDELLCQWAEWRAEGYAAEVLERMLLLGETSAGARSYDPLPLARREWAERMRQMEKEKAG